MNTRELKKYKYEESVLKFFLKENPIVSWKDLITNQPRTIDFRFRTEQGIVGIELTRFSRDEGASAKRQSLYDSIVKEAQKIFCSKNTTHLHVNVHLWHKENISSKNAKQFSVAIAATVLQNLDYIKTSTISNPVSLKLIINNNIEGKLYVRNVGDEFTSLWDRNDPCWVRQFPYTELQSIINKKNQKANRYRSCCDKIYLLVSANRMRQEEAVTFDDNILKRRFYSQFDKVFFFDICTKDLYPLKITKLKCLSEPYVNLQREIKQKSLPTSI